MAYYTGLFYFRRYKLRHFRGPLAFPIVGNYYTAELAQFYGYVGKLRKKYGKWYTLWCGASPMIVCCDAEAVKVILNDTTNFVKGKGYSQIFSFAFGEGLVTASGEKHKKDRSRFHKYFTRLCVLEQLPILNSICREGTKEFMQEKMTGGVVDFETVFARFALRTFGNFALHHDFSQDKKLEGDICHKVSTGSFWMGLAVGMALPMNRFVPWASPIHDVRTCVIDACRAPVAARRAAVARGDVVPDDPLTAMLKDGLTNEDIDDHIMTLVCAGHDTTAFFCAYVMYLLAKYPEVQEKLRLEVQAVMQGREEVQGDDLNKFVYMRQVFQEVLRFYAIIPGIQRTTARDYHFKESNVTVPAGTTLLIPLFVMNRDAELWENPQEFRPERFEPTTKMESSLYDAKRSYLPFGYGTRMCIGQQLAVVEASVFFGQLLQKYRFSPDPAYRPAIRAGISLTTTNGIRVKVDSL